jgi:hypothetical protein
LPWKKPNDFPMSEMSEAVSSSVVTILKVTVFTSKWWYTHQRNT